MVSRKKLKGKARKAVKAEAAAGGRDVALSLYLSKQLGLFLTGNNGNGCTHGWDPNKYPADHDCNKFIGGVFRTFVESTKSGFTAGFVVNEAVSFTHAIFPDVWSDSASLEWIAAAFISLGTFTSIHTGDVFLCGAAMGFSESLKQHVACYHVGSQPLIYTAKIDDLLWAEERRTISYLKKRIPCKCLNAKYKAVKSLPKMYTCCNTTCSLLDNSVNLSAMMTCGGCRREHYCSEECQAAHWEDHRDACKGWRKWNAENCTK
mmetsp:Transcript_15487/g.23428  ORF Transcript_15487/g.23428 Transcript_15487/m.23428 type:complete len:262 (-) Transcript_15487:33-818(-)